MKDSFGRKINYLRVSLTDLCNLRCRYCMPKEGVNKKLHKDILTLEQIELICRVFISCGVNKIRLTGGEPLVRKGIVSLINKISQLKGINDFSMTTNGVLLKKYAKDLKRAGLNRVNISLDTLDKDKYSYITRGGNLENVLSGIKEAKKVGLNPIKINTVLIGEFNENEIINFVNLTKDQEIDVRFIELMPIGQAASWNKKKFVSNNIVLDKVDDLEPTKNSDISSPAVYYKLKNGKGRIGIINPISCKFCNHCNRVRLTSEGKLKLCLHSDNSIDLKPYLDDEDRLRSFLLKSIKDKPKEHKLEEGKYISEDMVGIGG